MEQIRPLTSLSQDELIARIEQYIVVVELRDAEIRELHTSLDALKAKLNEAQAKIQAQEQQMEAIGAGGVSGQRITGGPDRINPNPPELSIVWHDSPEGVDRAMWEDAAQDAGLSYEELRDSVTVGQDENGAQVELTHAQTVDAIRNQGCWGFVDTNTGTIHAWAADDADPMLVVHMLAHEIGHMTGEQRPDELQEEMRAEQFGRVAAMAFRMWRQRWPLTIVEGAR